MLPIDQVVGVVGPLTLGTKIKFESMRGHRCVDPFADVVGDHYIIYKESGNLRRCRNGGQFSLPVKPYEGIA